MSSSQEHETDALINEQGYDDHFHEHHHGDKFQSNFWFCYNFSLFFVHFFS